MARVPITRTTIPVAGYNFTDSADFTTMATGANNGIEVPHRAGDVLVLANSTGGAATFTIKVRQPAAFTALGITVPDDTLEVADGKTYMLQMATVFRQEDGNVYIDCDVAADALLLGVAT